MKKISIVFLILSASLVFSCDDSKAVKPEIEEMRLDISLIRFDSIFAKSQPQDLNRLKSEYSFMFQNSIPDSLWQLKMQDSLQNEIEKEVLTNFSDFSKQKSDIKLFFKHLKYYFPEENIPKIVTLAEYVDYKSKVILNDNLLYISLDNYLGQEHRFYTGLQNYISTLQDPDQILPDIAEQYAKKYVDFPGQRNFLSQIVYHGKKLYLKSQLLPLEKPHNLIGYSQDDYAWAQNQEYMIWQYFVERDLLYSSETDLRRRFLQPGPFSKFYLKVDNESPPRLGQYIGWQIVKAYAEKHSDKSLIEILRTPEQDLFNQSKYKP